MTINWGELGGMRLRVGQLGCLTPTSGKIHDTGAKDLAQLCAGLENIGLEGRIHEAKPALGRVIHQHARVAVALEALEVAA
jgi:hypothetical protein